MLPALLLMAQVATANVAATCADHPAEWNASAGVGSAPTARGVEVPEVGASKAQVAACEAEAPAGSGAGIAGPVLAITGTEDDQPLETGLLLVSGSHPAGHPDELLGFGFGNASPRALATSRSAGASGDRFRHIQGRATAQADDPIGAMRFVGSGAGQSYKLAVSGNVTFGGTLAAMLGLDRQLTEARLQSAHEREKRDLVEEHSRGLETKVRERTSELQAQTLRLMESEQRRSLALAAAQRASDALGNVALAYSVAGTGNRLDANPVDAGENTGRLSITLQKGARRADEDLELLARTALSHVWAGARPRSCASRNATTEERSHWSKLEHRAGATPAAPHAPWGCPIIDLSELIGIAAADTSSLFAVIHGAAPCPVHVKQRLIEWLGPVVWEYYGATEGAATLVDPHTWLRKPGTVGQRDGIPLLGGNAAQGGDPRPGPRVWANRRRRRWHPAACARRGA